MYVTSNGNKVSPETERAPSPGRPLLSGEFALVKDQDAGVKKTFSEYIGDGNQATSSSVLEGKNSFQMRSDLEIF